MKQTNADVSTEEKFNQIPCKLVRHLTVHYRVVLQSKLHHSFFVPLQKKSIFNLQSLSIPVCYSGPSTISLYNTHPQQQAASLNAVSEHLFFFKQAPYKITWRKAFSQKKCRKLCFWEYYARHKFCPYSNVTQLSICQIDILHGGYFPKRNTFISVSDTKHMHPLLGSEMRQEWA